MLEGCFILLNIMVWVFRIILVMEVVFCKVYLVIFVGLIIFDFRRFLYLFDIVLYLKVYLRFNIFLIIILFFIFVLFVISDVGVNNVCNYFKWEKVFFFISI